MGDDRDGLKVPGEDTLNELGWDPGPLYGYSEARALWRVAQLNADQAGWAQVCAFEGLAQIAATLSQLEEGSDRTRSVKANEAVPIPRWILELLASGWYRYRDDQSRASLGEVYDLEGHGQGKRPIVQSFKNFHRNLRLALDVTHCRKSDPECRSIEDAIFKVANRLGVSDIIVKKAYYEHKDGVVELYNCQQNPSAPTSTP